MLSCWSRLKDVDQRENSEQCGRGGPSEVTQESPEKAEHDLPARCDGFSVAEAGVSMKQNSPSETVGISLRKITACYGPR